MRTHQILDSRFRRREEQGISVGPGCDTERKEDDMDIHHGHRVMTNQTPLCLYPSAISINYLYLKLGRSVCLSVCLYGVQQKFNKIKLDQLSWIGVLGG